MSTREAAGARAPDADFRASEAHRCYVVWLLCGGYTINIMDRTLLSILMERIREEFGLTDTHMGFLGGLAFGESMVRVSLFPRRAHAAGRQLPHSKLRG